MDYISFSLRITLYLSWKCVHRDRVSSSNITINLTAAVDHINQVQSAGSLENTVSVRRHLHLKRVPVKWADLPRISLI